VLKNIIGDWGSGLSDGDYACALAALGVLEATGTEQHHASSDPAELLAALSQEFDHGERTPVWRGAKNLGRATTVASWRQTVHTDAAALAESWRNYIAASSHPRQRPRLALKADWRNRPDLFDFDSLWAWLSRQDNGLQALVMADGHASLSSARWHWPLRVGVPAGAQGAETLATLRDARNGRSWVADLARCYEVGVARDACDLLILTPAATAQILEQSRTRIRASFIVCLEDSPPELAQLAGRYAALRERLKAAGVAVIHRTDKSFRLSEWFVAVLREVSHDLPIHAAVWGTGQWRFNLDQLLIGVPGALDKCRILAIAERQDRVVAALEAAAGGEQLVPVGATLGVGDEAMPTFGGPGGGDNTVISSAPTPIPPFTARRNLAEELRNRQFVSESVDGMDTVRELAQQKSDIDEARLLRWIQANAWRPDAPEIAARSLAPQQWNLLGIHIGPSEGPRSDAPFVEGAVDFSRGDVVVSVQVELSGANVTALDSNDLRWMFNDDLRPGDMRDGGERAGKLLSGPLAKLAVDPGSKKNSTIVGLAATTIVLPPAGDSTLALFAVFPADDGKVEGRVAIIYKNRVLQTARLSVGVGAAAGGAGLDVVAEAAIHPRDDDLEERREYDVTIQVSDVGGKLHLAIQHDQSVKDVQLDELEAPILDIGAALERTAVNWDYSKTVLEQDVFAETLYALADNGAALEQHLRKKCGDDVDSWHRIHLIPTTNKFLPLEYVYDGLPPQHDAGVCPNMLGALDRGSCDRAKEDATSCPNRRSKDFVCPMHFWGFSRLIERNGTVDAAPGLSVSELRSAMTCVPSKQAYGQVQSILFAASNRAFAYETTPQAQADERASLIKALGALSGAVVDVSDWNRWREEAAKKPNLLVLVAHTDRQRGTRVLEIGEKKLLGYSEIQPDLSGAAGQPQLLLLLGCSAADVTENFQPYPERFRDAGVSVVLAPVAPIRGKDAVPIAKQIAKRLADRLSKSEPTTFGELMPLLRRELLLAGHPGVMGLLGFGDGDWLLGGQ
jgi:hypothetical protein